MSLANEPPDFDALRLRINNGCDPVGALIDIANGKPLRFVDIDKTGKEIERWEAVSVAARLAILRELKDALVPKISRNEISASDQRQNRDRDDWDTLLNKAAEKHRNAQAKRKSATAR